MKQYAYFPGCSLEKIAQSYDQSSKESAKSLGVELKELEDWNCCGATTYFHVDQLLANTLVARNLAIAEKAGLDLVAPCSACFKNAYFTNKYMKEDRELAEHINYALEEDNLHFNGNIQVHHLIDVFVEEIGVEQIKEKVTKPLNGLKVAGYYGCQIVRPRKNGENVEDPQFFEVDLCHGCRTGEIPEPVALLRWFPDHDQPDRGTGYGPEDPAGRCGQSG
jgi:heterodisulfide reductase subunit B